MCSGNTIIILISENPTHRNYLFLKILFSLLNKSRIFMSCGYALTKAATIHQITEMHEKHLPLA